MPYELVIQTAQAGARRINLESGPYTVGRARSNDLCYPDDASLSRKHLLLEHEGSQWWVTDCGSKNGTLLNGARLVGRQPLKPRDRVAAGLLTLTLVLTGQEAEDPGVVFVPAAPDLHPSATVMTSLEGLLSGEVTSTVAHAEPGGELTGRLSFESPAVRALFRAVRELAQHRPLGELFRLVLDLSIEAVRAERGVLMTLEGETLVPRAMHGQDLQISTAVRDRVLRQKQSLLVRNMEQEEALRRQVSIFQQQINSLMAVPLQTEDRVIGLVYVDTRSLGREFSPHDLTLLTALAHVGAIGIEQELSRQSQRDLERAAEIQRGTLPLGAPAVAGLDVAGHNAACRTVGGDYYDFIPSEGGLDLVLADVSGKGMSAAMLMMNLQARVQLLSEGGLGPAALLDRLNRSLCRNCPSNKFISLFVCRLEPGRGRLLYGSAGHNPPFLVRASGEVLSLDQRGSVLGIWPEADYQEYEERVGPGDLIAIYSDGVTEAVNDQDEEFGLERLQRILLAERGGDAAEIVAAVNRDVREFTGAAPAADDVTLVVARLT